jgi:hypothetical protein
MNGRRTSARWKGLGICLVRCAARIEEPAIDCDIGDDNQSGEHELRFPGESGRIDDCQEIVLNEALRVARLASVDAKVVLRIRERANATGELDEESPCGRGKMNNGDPTPARHECRTQESEEDECQVEQQDPFGGYAVEHDRGRQLGTDPRHPHAAIAIVIDL